MNRIEIERRKAEVICEKGVWRCENCGIKFIGHPDEHFKEAINDGEYDTIATCCHVGGNHHFVQIVKPES